MKIGIGISPQHILRRKTSIPGRPYAWWDAGQSLYTNGQTINNVPDLSGNGRTLSRTAGTMTYNASAVNGKGAFVVSDGATLACANFFNATIAANGTFVGVMKIGSNGAEPYWDSSVGWWTHNGVTAPQGYIRHNLGTVKNYKTASAAFFSFSDSWESGAGTYPSVVQSCQVDIGYKCPAVVNGNLYKPTSGNTFEAPRSGAMQFAELAFYDHKLTRTEAFAVNRYFATKYGTQSINDYDSALIYMGNSVTQIISTDFAAGFSGVNTGVFNIAISGSTIADMESSRQELFEIINDFIGRGKKVGVYYHQGQNNNFGGSTSAGTNTLIKFINGVGSTLLADLRAAGAKLLVVTPTPWNGTSPQGGATTETYRQFARTYIIANVISGNKADDYSDLGGTSKFGIWDDGTAPPATSRGDNPLDWLDEVHPTTPVGGGDITTLTKTATMGTITDALAVFSLNSASYNSGDPIIATDLSTGSPTSWQWAWSVNNVNFTNFVTNGTAQNPSLDSGEIAGTTAYIRLVVRNARGSNTSSSTTITVTN